MFFQSPVFRLPCPESPPSKEDTTFLLQVKLRIISRGLFFNSHSICSSLPSFPFDNVIISDFLSRFLQVGTFLVSKPATPQLYSSSLFPRQDPL